MIRKFVLFATWAIIAFVVAGCGLLGLATTNPGNEKTRIEETLRVLAAAGEREDIETLKAYIAGAIVAEMAGGADSATVERISQGHDEVVAMVAKAYQDRDVDQVILDPADISVAGGTASVTGRFVIGFSGGEGAASQCAGTAEAAFVSQGGKWVVTRVTVIDHRCEDGGVSPMSVGAPKHYFDTLNYLVLGQTNDQVKALQESLNFLGYNAGLIDGYFGPKTFAALRSFQAAAGLYVDGEFGPKSAAALNKALEARGGYFRYRVALTQPVVPAAGPTEVRVTSLRTGTIYETPVYTYQSSNPGPTLVFVGCIHGNEKSGHLALEEAIDRGITISRGRLVIVPEFNRRACEAGKRTLTSDYNRMFPVGKTPTSNIAREMWNLVRSQPDLAMVVDFHDGFVNSLGNTLIHTQHAKAGTVARKVRDKLNAIRPAGATGPKWRAFTEPISGSLTRKVGRDLGIPALEVELSGRTVGDPLSLRKNYAWEVIKTIGAEFGLTITF